MQHFCITFVHFFLLHKLKSTVCHNKVYISFNGFLIFLMARKMCLLLFMIAAPTNGEQSTMLWNYVHYKVYSYILYKMWVGRHHIKSLGKPNISSKKKTTTIINRHYGVDVSWKSYINFKTIFLRNDFIAVVELLMFHL